MHRGGCRKEFGSVDPALKGAERKKARADELKALRRAWQDLVNEHLAQAGEASRIDMRSYADQGVARMPEPKLPARWRSEPEAVQVVRELRAAQNAEAEAAAAAAAVLADIKAGVIATQERISVEQEAARLVHDEMEWLNDEQLMQVVALAPRGSEQAKIARSLLERHDQVQRLAAHVKKLQEQERRAQAALAQAQRHWSPIGRPAKVAEAQGVLDGIRQKLAQAVKQLDQLRRKLWPAALTHARRLQVRSYAAQLVLYERHKPVEQKAAAHFKCAGGNTVSEPITTPRICRVWPSSGRMSQKSGLAATSRTSLPRLCRYLTVKPSSS